MNLNSDDPKYTAYVLGELSDADRAVVEAEVQANPQVAAMVSETRATTTRLFQALHDEPLPTLTEAQRMAVLADSSAALSIASGTRSKPPQRFLWAAAISASLLLAVCIGWLLRGLTVIEADKQIALQSTTQPVDALGLVTTESQGVNGSMMAGYHKPTPAGKNNLQQIDLGVNTFEDKTGSYSGVAPSAVVGSDPTGNPAGIAAPPVSSIVANPTPSPYYMLNVQAERSGKTNLSTAVARPGSGTLTLGGTNAYTVGTTVVGRSSNNSTNVQVMNESQPMPSRFNGPVTFADRDEGQLNQSWAAQSNLPQTTRMATIHSSTSPDAVKAALVNILGDKPQQQHGWGMLERSANEHNTEAYDYLVDNPILAAGDNPLSTFSIDVDTASYSNIRRFLMQQNQMPPPGAVRIEELLNYFRYDYPQPEGERPFSVTTEVASCPWQSEHRLVRIGLKGREIPADKRPPTSLVFLIDVSGSMEEPNKLPLVQQSLKLLAEQLGENDKVAIVVYAGTSGLVLPCTRGDKRHEIIDAIERLRAGGSTNGGEGIQLAYEIASQSFIKGGVNRVILATDGDFNVGITDQDALIRLIQEKAKTGVFLTTLGFGYGNIKDSTMQKLADKGNGSNYYIDDLPEARKVLVEQIGGTLVTIAKDVKIQVEFNPLEVAGYRLIGYEKRMLAKEDFNNDKIDAGEIGAGHTVTALYEIVPVHSPTMPVGDATVKPEVGIRNSEDPPAVDPLRYVKPAELTETAKSGELFTLKLRYKQPDGEKSTLMETPVKDAGKKYSAATADFKFAAAVASFGMILRDSPYKGNATLAAAQELAQEGLAPATGKALTDETYRAEFVQLVDKAKNLKGP